MHPVIRIVSFVVLTAALSADGTGALLAGAVVLAAVAARVDAAAWTAVALMLRRLRWLWLSLAIVYFWLTPGAPLLSDADPALAAWLPTIEGVAQGLLRIAALAEMAVAAALLLHLTSRDQLFAALYWLVAPLKWLGVERERLTVRVALTLAAVTTVQALVRETTTASVHTALPRWRRWGDAVAASFNAVVLRAEQTPCDSIALPMQSAPPKWQWLVPLMLALVMLGATTSLESITAAVLRTLGYQTRTLQSMCAAYAFSPLPS